jgi:hypothetical protein
VILSRMPTESSTSRSAFATLLSALLLITASSALAHDHPQADCESPISLYHASYSAQFSGLNIDAVQKLEEIEPGIYRESLNAKNFIGKVNEQSTFKLSENQQLQPIQHSYTRRVFGRDRSEVHNFDWQSGNVEYKKDGSINSELKLETGFLDMITHRLQLRRDLNTGKQVFTYPVFSRGKLKQYNYRVVSEQILETAIGPLNTVKVERVIDDVSKTVTVWLATDWDYLIVKLEQSKGKDGHYLELQTAVINNKKITPLQRTDENSL